MPEVVVVFRGLGCRNWGSVPEVVVISAARTTRSRQPNPETSS